MARDARAVMRREVVSLLLAAKSGKVTPRLLPDVKDDDGHLTHTLELSAADLNPVIFYIEPATGFITKQSFVADAPRRKLIKTVPIYQGSRSASTVPTQLQPHTFSKQPRGMAMVICAGHAQRFVRTGGHE